jgi:hypothetical protein
MEKLVELLQQIQDLAGVAIDALQSAGGEAEAKPEGGKPGGPPAGGRPEGGPPPGEGGPPPEDR